MTSLMNRDESLLARVKSIIRPRITLTDYTASKIEEMEQGIFLNMGKPYSKNSIYNWKKLLNVWRKFELESQRHNIQMDSITLELYCHFMHFCDQQNYKESTKYLYASVLKAILNAARREKKTKNGIQDDPQFVTSRTVRYNSKIYLTEEEIYKISKVKLKAGSRMMKARDIFLIGCYTGQRFSDYIDISYDDIVSIDVDGVEYKTIVKKQVKTGNTVMIPILYKSVFTILKRWGGKMPKMNNWEINSYIKTICRMAGITEPVKVTEKRGGAESTKIIEKNLLVSSHTARRSFITNLYLSGKLDTSLIRSISGHQSDSSFKRYLCQSMEDQAKAIFRIYNK